jgi:hypothetical protein
MPHKEVSASNVVVEAVVRVCEVMPSQVAVAFRPELRPGEFLPRTTRPSSQQRRLGRNSSKTVYGR